MPESRPFAIRTAESSRTGILWQGKFLMSFLFAFSLTNPCPSKVNKSLIGKGTSWRHSGTMFLTFAYVVPAISRINLNLSPLQCLCMLL